MSPILRSSALIVVVALTASLWTIEDTLGFDVPQLAPLNSNAFSDDAEDSSASVAGDGRGNWIAVWATDDPTISRGAGLVIAFATSQDDGQSWSDAALLSEDKEGNPVRGNNPEIATDRDGTWIVVWSGCGTGAPCDLFVLRSLDNGNSWSSTEVIDASAEPGDAIDFFPRLGVADDGNLLLVWVSSNSLEGAIGDDYDLLSSRSIDGGLTWSNPVVVNSYAEGDKNDDFEPGLTWSNNQTWVVVWVTDFPLAGSGSDRDIMMARTLDGGVTWDDAALVNNDFVTDDVRDDAPRLAADGDNGLVCVFQRSFPGASAAMSVASTDLGANWTDPQSLVPPHGGTIVPFNIRPSVATDRNGTWVAAWRSLTDLFLSTGHNDQDTFASMSTDGGMTWSGPRVFDEPYPPFIGFGLQAEPASDRNGTWLITWESMNPLDDTIGHDDDLLYTRFEVTAETLVGNDCDKDGIPDEWETDCNRNCIPDDCDILDGTSPDEDGDGVPDECIGLCGAITLFDGDDDGDVDLVDVGRFILIFSGPGAVVGFPESCHMDSDGDGDVDLVDFAAFQLAFTGAGG